MGVEGTGYSATQTQVYSQLCPSLAMGPWGPTVPVQQLHAESSLLVALGTANKELRWFQPLRSPRDPELLSLQVCGGHSSSDSFFAGGSWKVWLLELQATPSGTEADASPALERRPGPPAHCPSDPQPASPCSSPPDFLLPDLPRTDWQLAPSGHMEAPQHPIQDCFLFQGKKPLPTKVHGIWSCIPSKITAGKHQGRHGNHRSEPSLGSTT